MWQDLERLLQIYRADIDDLKLLERVCTYLRRRVGGARVEIHAIDLAAQDGISVALATAGSRRR
jgi:hypothetical protein